MSKRFDDGFSGVQGYLGDTKTWKATPRCHESHPVLKLGKGKFLAGSCSAPRSGYDIYVGLDGHMAGDVNAWPWSTPRVELVHFTITDHMAPRSNEVAAFHAMVEWLCNQLQDGKNVHIGCIGGHGRSGLLLAAVVATLGVSEDAIAWVRENHCKKAVESQEQVNYLVKHFGCKTAAPSKATYAKSKGGNGFEHAAVHTRSTRPVGKKEVSPAKSAKSIWND